MESSTGLGAVLGSITGLGKSYFESESASKNAKAAQKNALATSTLSVGAQKTLWVSIFVVVGLIVVALIWRGRS